MPSIISADFRVVDLASLKLDDDLDLLPFFQPTACPAYVDIAMKIRRLRAQLDRLDLNLFLVFARLSLLLGLLVLELTKVHYPYDRRASIWGDFYEVQAGLIGYVLRFLQGNDTPVASSIVNQTYFASPNSIVYAVICAYGPYPCLRKVPQVASRN